MQQATTIWLVPASGPTTGCGVRSQFKAAAAYAYLSNNRRTGAGFGDGGSLGIITIAPTIKPRGGFFTRPELRAFATFAVWSDEYQGRHWRYTLRRTRTTAGSSVSKLRPGSRARGAI